MKRIEKIPEYSVEVRFYDKIIQCYDLISKEIVTSKTFKERIKDIQKTSFNRFLVIDDIGKKFTVYINLVKERSRAATNAQYILDLHMDTPNHGYYFGLYEIGEFFLIEDIKLIINRSYPLKYCTRGCVTPSKQFYLGLRESKTINGPHFHFLMKLDWNRKQEPLIIWKKPVPSSIIAICLMEDRLFLGLKTGNLQIWDIKKEECEEDINLFESAISVIEVGNNKIIIASWTGETTALSKSRRILWKTKLSKEKIVGIYEDNNGIKILDSGGNFFHLNSATGAVVNKLVWDFNSQGGASNLIVFRDWFVATGGTGIWAHWSKDYSISYHYDMNDPLIRKLYPHPLGFFTGDDDGYIRFWKIGELGVVEYDL